MVRLMDVRGAIILQENNVQFNESGTHTISVNSIIPGHYILSILIDDIIITKTIVIAHN